MAINTTTQKVTANGNGVATVFSFSPITVFETSDLVVTFVSSSGVETVLTEGTGTSNYSVSLTSTTDLPSTGSITYPATLGTQLQTGEKLVIKRTVALLQETELGNQGGYFPEVQEDAFDYARMVDIQQQEEIDRSLKIPVSSSGVTTTLPAPEANKALVWNSSANAIQNLALNITVDNSALVVVSGVTPGLVDGRIWVDTSVVGQRVIRICDGSDYNEITRFATAGGAITYTIPSTFTAALGVSLATAGTPLTLTVTDTGAVGVVELVEFITTSPAVSDVLWRRTFRGRDSAPSSEDYAEDKVVTTNVTTGGTEAAERVFGTKQAGTLADRVKIGGGLYTPAQTDKGTNTINATDIYIGGTLVAKSDVSIISTTTHSPVLLDHGKKFIYTNASGCTVTLPAASGLFPGWTIKQVNASTGQVINNRSSTDTIWSKNTSLTTLRLPSVGDAGELILDSTGGSAKFYWVGSRTFTSADITPAASTTNTQAHNLGVIPTDNKLILRNTTSELGYAVGDEIQIDNGGDRGGAQRNYQLTFDTTNGVFQMGTAATVGVLNKTTPATWVSITTLANWRHVWRARVIN